MSKGKKNSAIDLQKLHELMQEAIKRAEEAKNKSPILFIGNTGAGKSTTIDILYGCKMQSIKVGGDYRLEVVGESIAEIGHTNSSKTLYPQIIMNNSLVFADCPGFSENRKSPEIKLCAAQGVRTVIEKSESIRGVVIVIDYPSLLAVRAKGFIDVVNTVAELLKDITGLIEDEKNAISFVITKVPFYTSYEDVIARIKKIKSDLQDEQDPEDKEDQRQLEMLSLMEQSNLFIIRGDGKGYDNLNGKELSLEENKDKLLGYLNVLPLNSINKESFMLLDKKSKLMEEVRQQTARIKLYTLANLAGKDLCTVMGTSEDSIHKTLNAMQTEIIFLADGYLQSLSGKVSELTSKKLVLLNEALLKDLSVPLPAVSIVTIEQLIKTLNYLRELQDAINVCFKDETIFASIATIIKKLIALQSAIHYRLSIDNVARCKNYEDSLVKALPDIQKIIETLAAELTILDTGEKKIISDNATERKMLEDDLADKEAEVTRLVTQGRPAILPNPGPAPHVPPHPGTAPANPGPEPHVEPHPGPAPAIAGGGLGVFGLINSLALIPARVLLANYNAAVDRHNESVRIHGEWTASYNTYQTYHTNLNAHNTAITAYNQWQANYTTYHNSINAGIQYDSDLRVARSDRDQAKLILDNFNIKAKQDLDIHMQKITTENDKLHAAQTLQLLIIGAQKALANLQLSPQRNNAIAVYKIILNKLNDYKNALPKGLIEQLSATFDTLNAEDININTLYKDALLVSCDSHYVVLEEEQTIEQQLSLLTPAIQYVALNHLCNIKEVYIFFQRLRLCSELITLDLHDSGFDKKRFAKLLSSLSYLVKLNTLDLSHNQLDDDAGITLLALIYVHPALVNIKLEGNRLSPTIIAMINSVLALKQSIKDDKPEEISKQLNAYLQNYLQSQELLSLSADKTEDRKFYVTVTDQDKFSVAHDDKSGKLKFAHYLDTLKACCEQLKLGTADLSTLLFKPVDTAAQSTTSASRSSSNISTMFFSTKWDDAKPFFTGNRRTSWDQATHWYEHDEIQQLLANMFNNYNEVELFTAIDAEQFNGETLSDNLYDWSMQNRNESLGSNPVKHLILPVNLGNRHWVMLHINTTDKASPMVAYIDPFGDPMPVQIRHALTKAFPTIKDTNIVVSPVKLQNDGYNCGPWIVECAKYLVMKGSLPPENLNINEARQIHQNIIRQSEHVAPQL